MSKAKTDKTLPNEQRRQFMTGLAVTAVAGAVASGISSNAQASEIDLEVTNKTSGYRETQHIRDYYDTL